MTGSRAHPAWFEEPSLSDSTYAERGEPTTDWLKRSTVPRAREGRRFLNENLMNLPAEHQLAMYRALHDRWPSAFFEMIVARTLQVLGAEIEVEPGGKEEVRIDFVARFPDSTIGVEAVSPVFNADVGETARRRIPLLDIVESLAPAGWRVMVIEVPDLGPSDSKRAFKRTVEELLDTDPPGSWSETKDLIAELPDGDVHLRLLPRRDPGAPEGPRVVAEPALSAFDNTEQRVRKVIGKAQKRRQGRKVVYPAILAVHATGISSEFEDFDLALFGREVGYFDTSTRRITKSEFQADGAFTRDRGEPIWSGVLAFVNVHLGGGPDPVLYLHPRFQGELPETLMEVERRRYDPEARSVNVEPPRRPGLLDGLNFASV